MNSNTRFFMKVARKYLALPQNKGLVNDSIVLDFAHYLDTLVEKWQNEVSSADLQKEEVDENK